MEKICEFCTALRPVIYCKADAAFLCLSCDAKIHSANALSKRHLRTLLCDSCRNRPAYARCMDHRMFVCRGCDQSIHGGSSQHQRRILSSYMGCPPAKDFAALWGFALDDLDKVVVPDQLFSNPFISVQPSKPVFDFPKEYYANIGSSSRTSKLNYSTLIFGAQSEVGFRSKQAEKLCRDPEQQNIGFILQQILDLKKLQLTEMDSHSPVTSSLEETDVSSSVFKTSKKFDDSVNHVQKCQDAGNNDSPLQELKVDSLPLPFSQSEHIPLPTTAANPLLGEYFWQCKSPVQSSEFWSQNMQDLGVCEDIVCRDDFNIPDVDITFCNFEELFGTEQDPIRALLHEKDASCSSVEKDMSLDTSHNINEGTREGTSVAPSAYINQPVHVDKDKGPSNQVYRLPGSLDIPQTIRPSYSAMSFSISRLSADSSGTECLDSGLSPYTVGADVSFHSPDMEGLDSEAKENAVTRNKEKKKTRMQEKQIRYAPRKARSDVRKKVKGRVVKTEDYDSDCINGTRSY